MARKRKNMIDQIEEKYEELQSHGGGDFAPGFMARVSQRDDDLLPGISDSLDLQIERRKKGLFR